MLASRLAGCYTLGRRVAVRPGRLWLSGPDRSRSYSLAKPEEGQILASIEGGLKSGPAEPMPEDAKGQAVSAFRRIGFVLRALLYSGLGVGTAATVGFFGLHLWVEYLELPPSGHYDRAVNDQHYGWDEPVDGWGGGHLGKGTDPRLGWRIRALVRAAWVAENWQSGQLALDSDHPQQPPDGRLVDSGYAISESRLQQAILMAKETGLKADDRTLFELQLRLAHVCERINTPLSLMKSYEIYSELWKSCVELIDRFDPNVASRDWEVRQAIRIADRLGQIGLRLAAHERQGRGPRAEFHQKAAENYLIWAISRGLGIGSSFDHSVKLQSNAQSTTTKNSTWSTLFGQLDQQAEDSSAVDSTLDVGLPPITEQLRHLSALDAPSEPVFKPAQLRQTISSLINLSVHLVSVDIQKAFAIQDLIDRLIDSAIKVQENERAESADGKLHYYWLRSRAALSSVYLSEIGQATKHLTDQAIIDRCRNALEIADWTLSNLGEQASSNRVFQPGTTRSVSGRLSEQLGCLERDVRLTATMAATFLGLKYESCPSKPVLARSSGLQSSYNWCYLNHPQAQSGCQLAKLFFQRAVDYSLGNSQPASRSHQPLVLLNPLNENLAHLSRLDNLSKNP